MIKVFVGTDSSMHGNAEKVIKYSIEKNTTADVDIQFIDPGWKSGSTGFTLHRFIIPELCNYEGYAIYLDVDMLILEDIRLLWGYKREGSWCITPGRENNQIRDEVAVIDCSAFTDLPKIEQLQTISGNTKPNRQATARMKTTIRNQIGSRYLTAIPTTWNSLDEKTPNTKLIHYSDLSTQPWHPIPGYPYKTHPNQDVVDLFFQYLEEANA